ncbi:c-type cytochrome [Aidingimonas halophila]|uniref:Cytochrome c553 n=1 Tax=Aidingimonas halophila TaxID=574349 RepID=A0A1H2Y4Z2_9GAMM|nr:c-type cytochrome [Aidingimonas halophila]GHC34483.1 cytochrome c4 [Aidingimonas halophila]SDX00262.1 Cytochrome c553 [Aidingimonas halophila]
MRQLLASLAITLSALGVAHAQEGDPSNGEELAQECASCHGENGISSSGDFPSLAGQKTAYVAEQILDIRDGEREVPEMAGQVDDYSEQDAWDVAAYYAEMEPNIGEAKDDAELLERGEELYRAGDASQGLPACTACHGPTGDGINSAGYPALSGQQPGYTVSTLQDFASGERSNDDNGIMRDIASKMSEEDMEAVANYLFGLH